MSTLLAACFCKGANFNYSEYGMFIELFSLLFRGGGSRLIAYWVELCFTVLWPCERFDYSMIWGCRDFRDRFRFGICYGRGAFRVCELNECTDCSEQLWGDLWRELEWLLICYTPTLILEEVKSRDSRPKGVYLEQNLRRGYVVEEHTVRSFEVVR